MDYNLHDFFVGNDIESYKYFGAHPVEHGFVFRVYAPHAQKVSVVGGFNDWTGDKDIMTRHDNGVWEITVPEAKLGQSYKYRVVQSTGDVVDKIDPYAFYSEFRPNTASILTDLSYENWTDQKWMEDRTKGYDKPVSIYEVHLGSWLRKESEGSPLDEAEMDVVVNDGEIKKEEAEVVENDENFNNSYFLKYYEIADQLVAHCKKYSFSHIELMPLTEHPFDGSWGYQDTGYFSATSRYGTNRQLQDFVNKMHANGIGVIMDFVPVHFVKDNFALARFDGSHLYEYQKDEDANSEWGTLNFDLWKETVRSFLMSSANYWLEEYHMDGLRMDAISNAIFWKGNKNNGANEGALNFMKRMNYRLNDRWQGKIMLIAEDSTDFPNVTKPTWAGGLGFDYKWDMGWMNDTLKYLKKDPIYRQWHHNDITFSMAYFYSEKFILPFSHDEVVHGKATIVDKMWGSYEDKFSQARALYGYMFTHPGKKLNFMGNEIGMLREWDEQKSVDWFLRQYPMHQSFERWWQDIAKLNREEDAFWYGYDPINFEWINADDAQHNVFSYMRKGTKKDFIILLNFSTNEYRLQFGVPNHGIYTEVLNSQWPEYNGTLKTKEEQSVRAIRLPLNNQPFRIECNIPAFSCVIFEVAKTKDSVTVDPTVSKGKETDWINQENPKKATNE